MADTTGYDLFFWSQLFLVGSLAGMIGQILRSIAGLKKLAEDARDESLAFADVFVPSRLVISLLLGAVAGLLAAFMQLPESVTPSPQMILGFMAAGYAGADFIEAFARDYLPKPAAQTAGGGAPAAPAQAAAPVPVPVAATPVPAAEQAVG